VGTTLASAGDEPTTVTAEIDPDQVAAVRARSSPRCTTADSCGPSHLYGRSDKIQCRSPTLFSLEFGDQPRARPDHSGGDAGDSPGSAVRPPPARLSSFTFPLRLSSPSPFLPSPLFRTPHSRGLAFPCPTYPRTTASLVPTLLVDDGVRIGVISNPITWSIATYGGRGARKRRGRNRPTQPPFFRVGRRLASTVRRPSAFGLGSTRPPPYPIPFLGTGPSSGSD